MRRAALGQCAAVAAVAGAGLLKKESSSLCCLVVLFCLIRSAVNPVSIIQFTHEHGQRYFPIVLKCFLISTIQVLIMIY